MTPAPLHLAICIPGESMPVESVRCLTRLLAECLRNPPRRKPEDDAGEFVLSEHYLASSMLPYARGWLLDSAERVGATHLLLLDADMTYPPDTAHRLIEGVERFGGLVAANCPTRRPPIRWTARDPNGGLMDSSRATERWSHVSTVGVAVAMIPAAILEKVQRPAFNFMATDRGWIGEDVFFAHRLAAAGFARVVDHELSRQIGHVGAHEFTAADIEGIS